MFPVSLLWVLLSVDGNSILASRCPVPSPQLSFFELNIADKLDHRHSISNVAGRINSLGVIARGLTLDPKQRVTKSVILSLSYWKGAEKMEKKFPWLHWNKVLEAIRLPEAFLLFIQTKPARAHVCYIYADEQRYLAEISWFVGMRLAEKITP